MDKSQSTGARCRRLPEGADTQATAPAAQGLSTPQATKKSRKCCHLPRRKSKPQWKMKILFFIAIFVDSLPCLLMAVKILYSDVSVDRQVGAITHVAGSLREEDGEGAGVAFALLLVCVFLSLVGDLFAGGQTSESGSLKSLAPADMWLDSPSFWKMLSIVLGKSPRTAWRALVPAAKALQAPLSMASVGSEAHMLPLPWLHALLLVAPLTEEQELPPANGMCADVMTNRSTGSTCVFSFAAAPLPRPGEHAWVSRLRDAKGSWRRATSSQVTANQCTDG